MDKIRILAVDDEPDLRGLLRILLTHKGYEVLEAASGQEAVDLVRSEPQIDLVIMDIMMPIKVGVLLGVMSVICFITFIVLSCCQIEFGGLAAWLFPTVGLAVALILFFQGLSNIHLGMVYREVQGRPNYIVASTRNLDKK